MQLGHMTHVVGGEGGRVPQCGRASAKETIDFTGLISAISVNYSCVLIVWLEETKTASFTEQTCMLKQHVYSFACARLIRL